MVGIFLKHVIPVYGTSRCDLRQRPGATAAAPPTHLYHVYTKVSSSKDKVLVLRASIMAEKIRFGWIGRTAYINIALQSWRTVWNL